MSLAEELYNQLPAKGFAESETPPLLLDIFFLITVSVIHIIYASKFTNFSLSYLKAKCEEKKQRKKWSESKLYLEAILSHRTKRYVNININDIDEEKEEIYTKLWMQLYLIRNLLKLLLFISCCIVLILYISFLLNIVFEFLITCFVNYQNGSFLALIILPFLIFVNIGIIRFVIFGIIASWSINVDNIADHIASQQYHLSTKQYAHKDEEDDDDDDSDNGGDLQIKTTLTFRESLKGFTNEYFIAVHWRLLVVSSSVIATILALPTFSSDTQQTEDTLKDSFWCQLFLRYMILAMSSWLFLYFCFIIAAGIYGRLTTLFVFNETLDETEVYQATDDNDNYFDKKKKNSFLRLFCLMDVFAIKDRTICWKRYKTVIFTLFFVSGILCIIIGSAIDNGLVRFVGVINMLYYIASILLTCKIRGIHYLWSADMTSLEMKNWWSLDEDDDDDGNKKKKGHHRYHSSESHAAGMTFLRHNHLQKLLSHRMINDIDEEDEDENENEEKSSVMISVDDTDKDENDNDEYLQTEEDVITLYISTFTEIYTKRVYLYEDRRKLIWYKDFCEFQKFNFKILCNYFYSTFKIYEMYWLLILPYNYSVRPLSVICSGKSISEQLIKYKYDKYTYSEIGKKGFKFVWHGIKGIVVCGIFIGILIGLLYLSVFLHDMVNDNNTNILIESINNNTLNVSIDNVALYERSNNYPICQLKWDGDLSVFDLVSLGHVAYEIEPDPNDQKMSMQELMCLYFDRIKPNDLNDSSLCSWQILYISRAFPAFMHLRNNKYETDIMSIRGTWTIMDMLQDIALFNEIALLQTASWIIPITTILPQSFIIRIVYFASWFEGRIDTKIRARFDELVFEYSYNYLLNTNNRINSFYYIGHSLGGGIAQIVAAQLYHINKHNHLNEKLKDLEIKSFSIAAPGLIWSSRKFSFDTDDLYQTATLLRPRHDIVSSIDKYGGLTQNIECSEEAVLYCHLTVNIICELSKVCNVYNSHNPNLIQSFCQYSEIKGEYYMNYANYSS